MAKSNEQLALRVEAAKTGQTSVANQLHHTLEKMKDQIKHAMPKHMSVDRMVRLCLTEVRSNPKLLTCQMESILACVMKAAQDGLEFGTGQCYLVPYKRSRKNPDGTWHNWYEAVYQRGYQGIIQLIRRSGDLSTIDAAPVYENDEFEFERGFNPQLKHKPNLRGDRGALLCFFAAAILKDGSKQGEVMTIAEVEAIRARSQAKDNGPWVTDYNEMGKKTVLRRLSKLLPMALEISRLVREEDENEYGKDAIDIDFGRVEAVKTEPANQATLPSTDPGETIQIPNATGTVETMLLTKETAYAMDAISQDPNLSDDEKLAAIEAQVEANYQQQKKGA